MHKDTEYCTMEVSTQITTSWSCVVYVAYLYKPSVVFLRKTIYYKTFKLLCELQEDQYSTYTAPYVVSTELFRVLLGSWLLFTNIFMLYHSKCT